MSRRQHLERLRHAAPVILPSLLRCDFGQLEREVRRLEEAGVAGLHLDVMDGHFVPNLTYGMPIVASLRRITQLVLDVHLMIAEPDRYLEAFYEAGADVITVHCEAVAEPAQSLQTIRDLGAGAGLAINPHTPIERLEPGLPYCDLVLVMSVEAGFGGQTFDPVALDRLRWVRQRVEPEVVLEIDGGINASTVADSAAAGAELLVVGSAIFAHDDYPQVVRELTSLAVSPTDAR